MRGEFIIPPTLRLVFVLAYYGVDVGTLLGKRTTGSPMKTFDMSFGRFAAFMLELLIQLCAYHKAPPQQQRLQTVRRRRANDKRAKISQWLFAQYRRYQDLTIKRLAELCGKVNVGANGEVEVDANFSEATCDKWPGAFLFAWVIRFRTFLK